MLDFFLKSTYHFILEPFMEALPQGIFHKLHRIFDFTKEKILTFFRDKRVEAFLLKSRNLPDDKYLLLENETEQSWFKRMRRLFYTDFRQRLDDYISMLKKKKISVLDKVDEVISTVTVVAQLL